MYLRRLLLGRADGHEKTRLYGHLAATQNTDSAISHTFYLPYSVPTDAEELVLLAVTAGFQIGILQCDAGVAWDIDKKVLVFEI